MCGEGSAVGTGCTKPSEKVSAPKYLTKLSEVASNESFNLEISQVCDKAQSEVIKLSECDIIEVFNWYIISYTT